MPPAPSRWCCGSERSASSRWGWHDAARLAMAGARRQPLPAGGAIWAWAVQRPGSEVPPGAAPVMTTRIGMLFILCGSAVLAAHALAGGSGGNCDIAAVVAIVFGALGVAID